MDRYQRVEKPRAETPINENEIRITAQGRMRNYITYATTLLQVSSRPLCFFNFFCPVVLFFLWLAFMCCVVFNWKKASWIRISAVLFVSTARKFLFHCFVEIENAILISIANFFSCCCVTLFSCFFFFFGSSASAVTLHVPFPLCMLRAPKAGQRKVGVKQAVL